MKKALFSLSVFILLTITISYAGTVQLEAASAVPQAATPVDPIFPGLGVITSRTMRDGRIATSNQAILGPQSCIHLGDPFSPLDSVFAPGPYTYTYRIYIPPTYAHDVVRVELFDPDSMNTATNSVTINRSNTAINNGLGAIDVKTCGTDGGSSSRIDPCLLRTDELNLINSAPNLDLDQVNPYWFVRIDENRIRSSPTSCGSPSGYTTSANTQTRYSLSYFAQNPDETIAKIPLVDYFGQTGDGIRDTGNHLTDMRWVSPGAEIPFSAEDSPGVNVPAIARTIDSFEVDLTTDVPNIFVDPATGGRYLYLDVQAMSGTSENGYEVWAGPPTYVNTIPSEVNTRNLHLLNHPGSHDAAGVEITAVNTLLQNSDFNSPLGIPLAYVGPELAGQTINVSLFDTDSGAQPPIIFYFDSIAFTPANTSLGYDPAQTDWAMAFAVTGQDDPDGVAEDVRCGPGNCPTQWVDPPYQVTVPGDLSSCDWQNPTAKACTPFYGGRLMVRYDGGFSDTYAWELSSVLGSDPIDQTAGCTAFPIGIHEAARSVTAPDTGSNPYPDAGDFSYPTIPPNYASFLDHQDDVPLLNATPGDIFRVQNSFGWLVWNTGVSANSSTLANSLAWPGDSTDYSPCSGPGCPPGPGVPGSGFNFNVRGYIEPADPTDHALHIGDWIAGSSGTLGATAVQDELATHIDLERTLRLPVWDITSGGGTGNQYRTAQFAIFRVIGYNITESWLLLEFLGFDSSCGQIPVAPTSVTITGPTEGSTETSYSFTATVNPDTITTPITYTWEITDHDTITNTGGINNTIMLDWSSGGSKTVTVTAVNSTGSSVSQSHIIDITLPDVAPASVSVAGPTEGEADNSYEFTATVNPSTTTTPVTYTWEITDHATITNTDGINNTIMLDWSSGGSKVVTVTAVNSTGSSVSQNHIIDITPVDPTSADKLLYLPIIVKNTSD